MSQLITSIGPGTRSLSSLPDIGNLASPSTEPEPTISFPAPVQQSEHAAIRSLMLDTAVQANRVNTPPEVVEQRSAPRYSLRELNSLDPEQLAERLSKVRVGDDRPGWVKALDIIDLPRNFVMNEITENFIPEANRMAIERGEYDQAGLVKVYGSDVLRAMGVQNKAVNAIGGLFIDIFTDPLSWLGGPIGGLKTLGSRGATSISTQGRRVLNSSINSVSKGQSIADDVTRKMLDRHLADGVAKGVLDAAADSATKAAYLKSTIFGQSGKLSNAADKVGIGKFTRGGTLAEDLRKSTGTAKSVTEAERIQSVKDFVAKYTNNTGIDLTKGAGGSTIAHIPFTTKSLTVPSFKVPGMRHTFGGAEKLQMAFAKASGGKVQTGRLITQAVMHQQDINKARNAIESSYAALADARRAGDEDLIKAAQESYDEVVKGFRELQEQGRQMRNTMAPSVMRNELSDIDDIDSLAATMDALEDAMVASRNAEDMIKFTGIISEVDPRTGRTVEVAEGNRVTRQDVANARLERQKIEDKARRLNVIDDSDTFMDALVNPERRSDKLNEIIDERMSNVNERWRDLIERPDADLQQLEVIADTYSEALSSAHELARRRNINIHSVMDSDQRMLAEAARQMLGISDADLGHLPLESFDRAFSSLGWQSMATRFARLGESTGSNLGGVRGNVAEMHRALRAQINGSANQAGQVSAIYARQLEALMEQAKIPAGDFDIVASLAGMAFEQAVVDSLAVTNPQLFARMQKQTVRGRKLIEEATKSGVLRNPNMQAGVKKLADDFAKDVIRMAEEMVRRGDIESPIAAYAPVILKSEALKQARTLRAKGSVSADMVARAAGPDGMDPTTRRVTNMVEFVDDEGKLHEFTIAEANAYKEIRADKLAQMEIDNPREYANALRVREGVEKFKLSQGYKGGNGEELENLMRAESVPMMPSALNEYAADGRLDPIIGAVMGSGENRRDFFETNLINMVYNRTAANEIARAKDSIRDMVEPFVVFKVDSNQSQATTIGAVARLSTGEKARVLSGNRIRVGDRTYVPISGVISDFPEDTLFDVQKLLGENSDGAYIPDTLAVQMRRLADTMSPEQIGPIMGAAESITSAFRTSTLLHPSWVVTNVVGNAFLAGMSGFLVDPKRGAQFMRAMSQAMRINMRRNAESLSMLPKTTNGVRKFSTKLGLDPDSSVIVGGQTFRIGDLADEAAQLDVIGQGRAADAQEQMLKLMEQKIPSLGDAVPLKGIRGQFKREVDKMQAGRAGSTRLQNAGDAVAAGHRTLPVGGIKRGIRAWFQTNAMVDDTFRLAAYMMYRGDGFDPVTAAQKTREGMLNFGDMSSFERNALRPVIPFYSWMRASLPAFAIKAIKDPKQLSAVPKIQTALEEAAAGEDRLPRHMRPRWLQETMAIQIGTDPETRGAFLAGTLLPQEGVIQAAQGIGGLGLGGFDGSDFMDTINWFMSQTSPAVRVPFELGTRREVFSGRDIGVNEGEGEVTLDDYLLNQIRPIKEFGLGIQKGKIQEAFEKSPVLGASRALIGGRLQQGLQEDRRTTDLYFNLKDKEAEFRKAIRLSEKRGDDARVAKLKFELLAEYYRYIQAGGEASSIPKWAREDLAAFAPKQGQ
jgi:Asp-tRNA(Asn)/Glu-tRNA(Gln) amidotransferase C subunit